ncbi:uncharacterized protein LOC143266319 [Megachile rotundata]
MTDKGEQAYAKWAMISRPTQTGMDLEHPPATLPVLQTIEAGSWRSSQGGRYRRGAGVQVRASRKNQRTQTPSGGVGRSRSLQRETEEHPTTFDCPKSPEREEADMSWEVIPETEQEDPIIEIPAVDPQDPLGLLCLTERAIDAFFE